MHKIKNMRLFKIIEQSNVQARSMTDNVYQNGRISSILLVESREVLFSRKITVETLLERINNLERDLEETFKKLNNNDQQLLKSITY